MVNSSIGKSFRKLKIWKFNENWETGISYLYSEMKFPISYLALCSVQI